MTTYNINRDQGLNILCVLPDGNMACGCLFQYRLHFITWEGNLICRYMHFCVCLLLCACVLRAHQT